MRVLFINAVCGIGSTGKICTDLAQNFEKDGHEVKIAYGRSGYVPPQYQKYAVRIGTDFDVKIHALKTRLFDKHGFGSKNATKKFLEWVEQYKPDLVWLHNIHGYYINIEILFSWLKKHPNLQIKWTLHDCWAFTGHCTHFTFVNCEKWKTGCFCCEQKHRYPASCFADNCNENFTRKRLAFGGISKMTLITPSKWLANLVQKSFLKEYPLEIYYNSIDTEIFKPTLSDFREKHGLKSKKIVLGVANVWDDRKGFDDFIKLSKLLNDNYVIVLVGVTKNQLKNLPNNILGIQKTNSSEELAKIYTAADVFVNPSREETFGMTTIEAVACGKKAIVYKDTACEEIAHIMKGIVVSGDIQELYETIVNVVTAD